MSPRQGDLITALLDERVLPWNGSFGGRAIVTDDAGDLPVIEIAAGMRITILAPGRRGLDRLGRLWEREIREAGLVPGADRPTAVLPNDSEAAGKDEGDELDNDGEPEPWAAETKLGELDPSTVAQLAERPRQPDASVANGSSIAMLLQFAGGTILAGGDARAEDLTSSIRRLLAKSSADRLRVDAFVLPHNGSRRNLTSELLRLLDCSTYLVSTSGTRFRHPDPEAIAMVLEFGRPSPAERLRLIFNYRSPQAERWANQTLQESLNYEIVFPDTADGGVRLDVVVAAFDLTAPEPTTVTDPRS